MKKGLKCSVVVLLLSAVFLCACNGSETSAVFDTTSVSVVSFTGSITEKEQESIKEEKTEEGNAEKPEEEKTFSFTRDNLPRLNGSTSTVPLGKAICAVLLGEDIEDVNDLVQFDKTTLSYFNLIAGHSDILIAAEPADSAVERLSQ